MSNLTYGAPAINRKNKRGVAVFIHVGGKVEYARDGQMMRKDKSGHELDHNYPSLPQRQKSFTWTPWPPALQDHLTPLSLPLVAPVFSPLHTPLSSGHLHMLFSLAAVFFHSSSPGPDFFPVKIDSEGISNSCF